MKNIISFILLTIIYNSSLSGKNLNNWIQSNYFDSINTQITIDSFGYNFIIENVTQDTLYIFSSYIDDKIIKTDDLKRISKRNDTLIISFLPLIPFVFTSKSDNLILNPSVFDKHQIVYEFKMVLPNSKIKLVLPKEILIPETQNSKLYCNFNEQKIITERKLLKAKKKCNYNVNRTYNYQVRFALYKDIKGLNDKDLFYLKRDVFLRIALDYKVITYDFHPAEN